MTREILFLVHESPEGGYEAEAMNHGIYTEADTLMELRDQIKDAVLCHFAARPAGRSGGDDTDTQDLRIDQSVDSVPPWVFGSRTTNVNYALSLLLVHYHPAIDTRAAWGSGGR